MCVRALVHALNDAKTHAQQGCAMLFSGITLMTCLLSFLDVDLPDDPYMSYLSWPHFHFNGTFRADVPTVNNLPYNYDTDKFVPADQLADDLENWNPKGSGEWSISGSVTHVCYADGHCVGDDGDKDTEPIVGEPILGTYTTHCTLLRLRVN